MPSWNWAAVSAGATFVLTLVTFAVAVTTLPSLVHSALPTASSTPTWKPLRDFLATTARGTMNALPVSVFDAFVEGRGELSARILGAFQVAGGTGADVPRSPAALS